MSVLLSRPDQAPARDGNPRPLRWDTDAYHRLASAGLIQGRTELIDGEILVMSPQGAPHGFHLDRVFMTLLAANWQGVWLRMQLPLILGQSSEPEPDISVVPGSAADYRKVHPTEALLVIEVSDATLAYDRGTKASLYARSGVPEYWILNLPELCLEVRRGPLAQGETWSYEGVVILRPGESVSPLAAPGVSIEVAKLFA